MEGGNDNSDASNGRDDDGGSEMDVDASQGRREEEENGSTKTTKRRRHKNAAMINQCIDNAIKEMFEHVHAPSLAHRDRQKVYALLEELLREFPRAMVLGGDFDGDDEAEENNAVSANEEDIGGIIMNMVTTMSFIIL